MKRLTNMERFKLMEEFDQLSDYTTPQAAQMEYQIYGGGESYTPGYYLNQKDPRVVVAAINRVEKTIDNEYGLNNPTDLNEWHEKHCAAIQEKWEQLTPDAPEEIKKALEYLACSEEEGYYPGVKLAERFG